MDSATILRGMDAFTPVIAVHATCALFVIVLGPLQILRRRRDRAHRVLGTAWATAMVLTCTTSFLIAPDGFSWLHGLAIWTLVCLVIAIVAIRRGVVPTHRGFMVGSYLGTAIAFAFATLAPGRAIPQLLREDPVVALVTLAGVIVLVAVGSALVIRRSGPRAEAALAG